MKNLKKISKKLRIDILKMLFAANSGHPGPSLSCLDILVNLFFNGFIKFDAKNPQWKERDYFILSKGHAAPALYAILGELEFFAKDHFFNLRQAGALLQGHPKNNIPGIEVCTGSLGQGLSVACGIALGMKIDQKPNKIFTLHGDGELQEGQIWEALMTAYQYKLGNLVAIIDKNNLQIDGKTDQICSLGDIEKKFQSFGWKTFSCDGHDEEQLEKTLQKAIKVKDLPAAIIAKTIKGKGVSFMENQVSWHGKALSENDFEKALAEQN